MGDCLTEPRGREVQLSRLSFAMNEVTSSAVAHVAAKLFAAVPGSVLQKLRPYICPFGELINAVPVGARLLDVGCGSGLFLGLLAAYGRIEQGFGFDSNVKAIARAKFMREQQPNLCALTFEHRDASADWPSGPFDVISIIDVMHHVPPAHQRIVIERAAAHLKPGGVLVYKDMVERPRWRAWMNRLHDLVLVREWIHYVPLDTVALWGQGVGLVEVRRARFNMFWYGHELMLLRARGA